jgi:hypothetical protein
VSIRKYSTAMETLHCSLPRQVVTVYLCQICTKAECNCSCKQVRQDASPTCDLTAISEFALRGFNMVHRLPGDSTPHEVAPGIATLCMWS